MGTETSDSCGRLPPVWWPNVLLFTGMHLGAVVGVYYHPILSTPHPGYTALLCFMSWQLAVFGITVGYHRLYSHRSFTARRPLRLVLALMGCLGFQGSIKWWCLRHRLHHRYTDDPVHDPYCATRGLYYSHMGWIFRKPTYSRMHLIDRLDLDSDPVVRFQHRYYIPLTVFLGLALPAIIANIWGDALGGLIYGGVVARLLIWHCTFIVNSFAHWEGLQPYSEEMTARGNLLFALLTGGEGNHNFHHAFPRDYRASPETMSWDPSKWIIELLYKYSSLVTSVRKADEEDIDAARVAVLMGHHHHHSTYSNDGYSVMGEGLPTWTKGDIEQYIESGTAKTALIVIDDYIVDLTEYTSEHPGGFAVLRPYILQSSSPKLSSPIDSPTYHDQTESSSSLASLSSSRTSSTLVSPCLSSSSLPASLEMKKHDYNWKDASMAFHGGMNIHSGVARRRMVKMRVARASKELLNSLEGDLGLYS